MSSQNHSLALNKHWKQSVLLLEVERKSDHVPHTARDPAFTAQTSSGTTDRMTSGGQSGLTQLGTSEIHV